MLCCKFLRPTGHPLLLSLMFLLLLLLLLLLQLLTLAGKAANTT
jgi:hypothetical protein